MFKQFGMTTLIMFVAGFGPASSFHVHAQATEAGERRGATDQTTDLTRVLRGREEESYRAWQSKNAKFWPAFYPRSSSVGAPPVESTKRPPNVNGAAQTAISSAINFPIRK